MHSPRDNEPSKLQLLMLLLENPSTNTGEPAGVPLTIRLSATVFARIDALSQHSGQNRNKVIAELIDVALADINNGLSEANRAAIDALQRDIADAMAIGKP